MTDIINGNGNGNSKDNEINDIDNELITDQEKHLYSKDKGRGKEEQKQRGEEEDEDERSPSEILLDLAYDANIVLFKDQYKIPHASIIVRYGGSEHTEIMRIESNTFRRYLTKLYFDTTREVIGSESVKNVVQLLQAKAEYEGDTYPLALRVAWSKEEDDKSIYYDITNDKWHTVKISKDGWEILDKTPHPIFTRYSQISQADPYNDYPSDIFDQFLKLTNLKNKDAWSTDDRLLLKVYIVTLFIPEIPHAMLILHGERGGAKSTLQEMIKMLADPAKPRLLTVYHDVKEFIQQLAHNHIAYYDNLKHSPLWLSDEACKAVTGVGSTKRKLYSDDEDIVYEYKRCLGFSGINVSLTEPDALDRSLMIELDRIEREKQEEEEKIKRSFFELRPYLLAYIFDILVKTLETKSTIELKDLPRMADFAKWGEAIARAMGYKENDFINAYYANIGRQNIEAIESNPLGQAVAIFDKEWYKEETPSCWTDLTTNLLDKLNAVAMTYNLNTQASVWPQSANALSKKLKVISSSLREGLGINITIGKVRSESNRGLSVIRISHLSLQTYNPYQTTFEKDFSVQSEEEREKESDPSGQTEFNLV